MLMNLPRSSRFSLLLLILSKGELTSIYVLVDNDNLFQFIFFSNNNNNNNNNNN